MSTRYATIITDDDGRDIVSAIGEFEGAAPQARLGRIEPVAPGVLIGMVRDAAGGFGFPQAGIGGQAIGLVLARLKAQAAKRIGAAKPAAVAKPKRPKRAKKRTRSRKPAGSMPKAGKAASDTAAETMGQVDG